MGVMPFMNVNNKNKFSTKKARFPQFIASYPQGKAFNWLLFERTARLYFTDVPVDDVFKEIKNVTFSGCSHLNIRKYRTLLEDILLWK